MKRILFALAFLLATVSHANATVYLLISGVTAQQSAPTAGGALPVGSLMVNLSNGGALSNQQGPVNQTIQCLETGSGNVSATIVWMASNDGITWSAYGSNITIASAGAPQIAIANGSQNWAFYTAYVSAISGTNATITCKMNA